MISHTAYLASFGFRHLNRSIFAGASECLDNRCQYNHDQKNTTNWNEEKHSVNRTHA